MGVVKKIKTAWSSRKSMGDQHKTRDLAQFLPAALEIQSTPPHPLANWTARSLIILFSLVVIWAMSGKVNVVASAEGKIIPSTKVKQIQPLEKAIIKKILVREGQTVIKGQPLVELDATLTLADEKRLHNELRSAKFQLAVSEGLFSLLDMPNEEISQLGYNELELAEVHDASEEEVFLHKRLLWQRWKEHQAQLKSLLNTLDKSRAEQASTREVISKFEQTLPIVGKRRATLKDLHKKNFASETEYLTVEQEYIQQERDLAAERFRLDQLEANEAEISEQANAYIAQASSRQLTEITETKRQIAALKEELTKATDLNAKRVLYAPVSGQVQQLTISTIGGVVTDAQQLMVIVPDEEKLEVEVILENKDIGFVREGMPAEIKVHTFPFTKYGVIDGDVSNVSDDAIADEQRGLIYTMRVKMDKNHIGVNGQEVKLIPGMAVTAEVQTGKRRIIEFFLAPLLKHGREGLRER